MGIIKKLKNSLFRRGSAGFISTSSGFSRSYPSLGGAHISADTALSISTVYACVNCISSAIKSIPLKVYKKDAKGSYLISHEYDRFLNLRAESDWSSADAWSYLIASKLLYGDGYALLIRADYRSSKIKAWKPIHPYLIEPFRDSGGLKKYKFLKNASGTEFTVLDSADVIQITSLGYDGLSSPSVIAAAGDVLKTAIAGQKWQSKLFQSGANYDYVLSSEHELDAEQIEELRESILASYSKDGGPLVLSAGLKPMSLTINPRDAELLNSRIFTMQEICVAFAVPLIMLGYSEKSTSWGSGIGELGRQFVRLTLLPHLTQIAQEFNYRLWPDRSMYYLKHDTSELERGDQKSRNEAHRVALGRAGEPGWVTPNEVRASEDLYPVPWGDEPSYIGSNTNKERDINDV